jgi:hypothetical protein
MHLMRLFCEHVKEKPSELVLGQHGPSAGSLGDGGSQGEWKGVQSLPQLRQPVPDVTVFGEM